MAAYQVSGTDASGVYTESGEYNGKSCYRRGSDAYYLWYTLFRPSPMIPPLHRWIISDAPGSYGAGGDLYWLYSSPNETLPSGLSGSAVYPPVGTATGDATVTEVAEEKRYQVMRVEYGEQAGMFVTLKEV